MSTDIDRSGSLDLLVRNGTLVIPGVGQVKADVGIAGGKIVAMGENLTQPAAETYDATGRTVLPGIFDPHTHIGNEQSYESEAETETRAAILGGVTTIGIFLRSLEDSYFDHLPAFRKAMDERSYVDSVFHPQIFTEQQIEEIPGYAEQFGIRSFKFYMSGMPGIVKSVTDDVLLDGFKKVASLGPDAVVCVHCETGALIDARTQGTGEEADRNAGGLGACAPGRRRGAGDPDRDLPGEARGRAPLCGAPLQSSGARSGARRAPRRRTLHGRNHHALSGDQQPRSEWLPGEDGSTGAHARTPDRAMGGLSRRLDQYGRYRQHVPRPRNQAAGSGPARLATRPARARNASAGATALRQAARHSARRADRTRDPRPARVYGIYPQKGTIAIGSDADLVVVDLDLERVVRAEDLQGMSDFSPFEGKTLRGWPVATIKGGKIIARDGKIVAQGQRPLSAAPARARPPVRVVRPQRVI